MIVSFADDDTFAFHRGDATTAFAEVARFAGSKLDQLDAATDVRDVNRPSNHLQIVRKHRRRGRRWLIPLTGDWGVGFEWPPGSGGPVIVGVVGRPSLPPEPSAWGSARGLPSKKEPSARGSARGFPSKKEPSARGSARGFPSIKKQPAVAVA